MRLTWPLTGRLEELRKLEDALETSDSAGIVVHGAAGVGKSRIAREALTAAQSRGWDVRWTVGTSSARAIPLGAFNAWTQSGVTDTVELVRGVIDTLTAASAGVTVLIGVDDAHLLDELSTFVVHQIVQRRAAKVVVNVLDGEPIPHGVQEIWKAGRFERLDLQPLSPDETTALLSRTLGGPIDPDAAQRLWRLTRGNPLYLRNIVEQELADSRLAQEHGYWRWTGEPIMPPNLVELIESRIGELPGPVGDVIDTLAVGEPIELDALRRITDPVAVEEADARGLITLEPVAGGVEVRVAHPLYSEVRRRHAPPTKMRRLRGLVAAELADSEDSDGIQVVVRRAAISVDSDLKPDPDLLVRAAYGAVWLGNLPLADRLAEAAVRAGAGPEPNFVRAHALSWLGRGKEADEVLAGIRVDALTEIEQARYAFLRASNMLWALGEPVRAKHILDEASHITTPEARRYVDSFLAVYRFAMDQPELAVEASKGLALADIPVVGAEIAWALCQISGDAGRTTDAVATADAGYVVATRSFDAPQMRFNIADAHIGALLFAGRLQDAADVAERVQREAADLPGAAHLPGAAVVGRAALGAGDLDSACSLLEPAAEGLSASHAIGYGYRYQLPRATALAMRGSVDEAVAVLAALGKVQRSYRQLDFEHSLARAWVAAGQGAVTEAIALMLSAAERAAAQGQFAAEVCCLQTATQFGDRTAAPRLRELEAVVEGPRVGLAARFAEALRDGDAGQLAALSEEFERMGDLVAAVDGAAHAALEFRRQDLRGSALVAATRASDLARRCGGVSTPALRQAGQPLPLTDREREVVMLLSEGLSNRDIADRLTLSMRTVESHIYRAMSKTGVTSREELAALLPRTKAAK